MPFFGRKRTGVVADFRVKGVELSEVHFERLPGKGKPKMECHSSQIALDLGSVLKGTQTLVPTKYGHVTVTSHGDPSCTPLITYHDVGVNHSTCFRSLLVCSSTKPLLMKNFCFYHIDVPGCEDGASSVPPEMKPMTMDKLADQVLEVIKHFNLKEIVGLGAGAGGHVLTKVAASAPGKFSGLILISPPATNPGLWEWTAGQITLQTLLWWGVTKGAQDYFLNRLLKPIGRSEDLANVLRQEMYSGNADGMHQYLMATLYRKSITDEIKKLKCRVLLLCGDESVYRQDCLHINTVIDRSKAAWVEIDSSGCLLTEERPQELLSPIQLFLSGLQANGYGFGWDLY